MNRFMTGGAMGFMLGAGMMMMPGTKALRRDMMRAADKMKRWMRSM